MNPDDYAGWCALLDAEKLMVDESSDFTRLRRLFAFFGHFAWYRILQQ